MAISVDSLRGLPLPSVAPRTMIGVGLDAVAALLVLIVTRPPATVPILVAGSERSRELPFQPRASFSKLGEIRVVSLTIFDFLLEDLAGELGLQMAQIFDLFCRVGAQLRKLASTTLKEAPGHSSLPPE